MSCLAFVLNIQERIWNIRESICELDNLLIETLFGRKNDLIA